MTWNISRIRGFRSKPPFATIASWQRGSIPLHHRKDSPTRGTLPLHWHLHDHRGALQDGPNQHPDMPCQVCRSFTKDPTICVGDVICISIYVKFQILLSYMLRNLAWYSFKGKPWTCISTSEFCWCCSFQRFNWTKCLETNLLKIRNHGVLKQIGFDFFVSGALCKWA